MSAREPWSAMDASIIGRSTAEMPLGDGQSIVLRVRMQSQSLPLSESEKEKW